MTKKIVLPLIFVFQSLIINAQVIPLNHLEYLRKADLASLCDYMANYGFKFFTLTMPDSATLGTISFYYPLQIDGQEKASSWIHQYFYKDMPNKVMHQIAAASVYQQYTDSLTANGWVQRNRSEYAGIIETVYMNVEHVLVISEHPYPNPDRMAYFFELWQKDAYLYELERDLQK